MDNGRIAERLDAFAALLELADANPYMARAYRRAAETIRSTPAPVAELVGDGRVRELRGIGPGIETRLRELKADTETVWRERDQMLDGIRAMADDLVDVAKASVARLQAHEPVAQESENPKAVAGRDEPTTTPADESASAVPGPGGRRSSRKSGRRG